MNQHQESTTNERKANNSMQWVATISVFMLTLQVGFGVGWASPNNARLLSEDSPIKATTSEISWLTSLVTIGAFAGSILGAIFIEYVGSRKTLLITYLFMGISWICLLVADSIGWLLASRLIFGIPTSVLFCCFSIYLGEISQAHIRGTLIALAIIGVPVGTVLGIIAETYLQMKVTTAIYLTLVLFGTLLFFWLKDTPYYLIRTGDMEAAKISISFYRGANAEKELNGIMDFVKDSEGLKDKLKKLKIPVVRKSIFMIMLVFVLPHLSGYTSIMAYMEIIFKSAKFDLIKPEQCVIYANIISVVSAFLTFNLIDKLGRKILLIISSVGTSIALSALGLHFYLLTLNYNAESLQWLPVTSIFTYLITYPIGYGTVPGALLSEMFPENIKSIAACAATSSVAFVAFIITKAYQPIVDSAGEAYAFWIQAIFAIVGVPCALFLIVETKGKTFQEIQNQLGNN